MRADGVVPEVVIPRPAFEVFDVAAAALGATVVSIAPNADFSFPLDGVLAAITPRTRLVIVTNPNNPTGISTPLDTIKTIARRMPPGAAVFVDEAYVDFGGETFVPSLRDFANVIVGRTFSKAYGLAGLRAGLLLGQPATIEPLRIAVPVYSINIAAALAVVAALWMNSNPATGGMQFVERHAWIPTLGVEYHVGLDGLGEVLRAVIDPRQDVAVDVDHDIDMAPA